MRILCKYPTRGRPTHFIQRLREWTSMAESPANLSWLVSYDADDATMAPAVIAEAESIHPSVICEKGNSKSKIEACNKNINDLAADWDAIILVSDDFFCVRQGWDSMIRERMATHHPDTDGVLWFHDGSKQRDIMTLSCMGRAYYERDRFIYHPSYFSFFCDNEATDVARERGKIVFIEQSIAHHHHPAWCGGMKPDATYARNNRYWQADKLNYERRKSLGFPQ